MLNRAAAVPEKASPVPRLLMRADAEHVAVALVQSLNQSPSLGLIKELHGKVSIAKTTCVIGVLPLTLTVGALRW